MASTQDMRDAYPEPVIGITSDGHPRCDHSIGVLVNFPTTLRASGELGLLVHPGQEEAWRAFASVMRVFDYLIRERGGGTANCRNIKREPFGRTSLHAHLSAIDLNPKKNTGTETDQPADLRRALEAIRANRSDQVFRNLSGDRMHWQINCGPARLATGLDASTMAGTPVSLQDREEEGIMDRETWRKVQEALQALDPPLYEGKPVDGLPGKDTNTSVRAFEKRVQLAERGVMGNLGDPNAGIWPASREILFAMTHSGSS